MQGALQRSTIPFLSILASIAIAAFLICIPVQSNRATALPTNPPTEPPNDCRQFGTCDLNPTGTGGVSAPEVAQLCSDYSGGLASEDLDTYTWQPGECVGGSSGQYIACSSYSNECPCYHTWSIKFRPPGGGEEIFADGHGPNNQPASAELKLTRVGVYKLEAGASNGPPNGVPEPCSCPGGTAPRGILLSPNTVETTVPCPTSGLAFNKATKSGSSSGALAFLRNMPCVTLNLEIIGESHGASIVDRNRLVSGGAPAVITVRATVNGSPTCYFDTVVPVGGSCGGCSGGSACGTGGATARLGSVDVRFDLGADLTGEPIGDLWLYGATPTAALGTPQGLSYNVVRPDVDVLTSSGAIRQILSPACLADITTDSSSKYTICFYSYSSAPEREQQSNLYVPPGQPFARWEIEYPNSGVLTIKKKDSSGNISMSYRYEGGTVSGGSSLTLRTLNSSGATLVEERETIVGDVRNHTLADDQGVIAFHERETYSTLADGSRGLTERILDPDGAHLVTTRTFRQSNPNQGRLESEGFPDGSWITYSYDGQGRISRTTQSYLDVAQTTSASAAKTIDYTYVEGLSIPDETDNPTPTVPDLSGIDTRPRIVTESTNGVVTAKTFYAYKEPTGGSKEIIEKRCIAQGSEYTTSTNLVTRTVFVNGNNDRIARIDFSDGRSDYYSYVPGAFSPNGSDPGNPDFDPNAAVKPDLQTIVTHGERDGGEFVANLSTRDITYTNRNGHVLFEATEAQASQEGSPAWHQIRWAAYIRDSQGRPTSVTRSDHSTLEITRDCCFEETATDELGMATTTVRDAAGRIKSQTRTGENDNQPIETRYYYDGASRVIRTVQASGSLSRETAQTFDKAGRMLTSTDESNLQTTYTYETASGGGRKVNVYRPNSAVETTEYFRDGRPSKRSGSGVVAQQYTYGVESDGALWSRSAIGTGTNPLRWTQSWRDIAGRTIRDAKPGWTANSTVHAFYDYYATNPESGSARKGRLARKRSRSVIADPAGYTVGGGEGGGEPGEGGGTLTLYRSIPLGGAGQYSLPSGGPGWLTAPEGAEVVYQYDALGNLKHQATKLTDTIWDEEYGLQFGEDRVRTTDTYFDLADGIGLVTKSIVYPGGSAKDVELRRAKFTGLSATETSRITTIDAAGNTTVSSRTFNSSDKSMTDTTYLGASMATAVSQTVTKNGLMRSVTGRSGNTTEFLYDALGRQTFVHDPRHTTVAAGSTTKFWSETHYNSANRVDFVKDAAGNQTGYEYDSAGQLYKITNAAGKLTYFAYDLLGRMSKTWGDVPQPVWIEYDPYYGDRIKLHTYRTDAAEMWDQAAWPSSAGNGDVTTWTYQNSTGLLKSKTYADNSKVEYTYEDGGPLKTRKWARSGGSLITTYTYYDGTGELQKIDYSDTSTPDVEYQEYDLLGRPVKVLDAVGLHTFSYDPATLKLWKEEISGSGALHTRTITRIYDTATANEKGRLVSLSAGSDYTSGYGYDSYGRLNNVRGPGLPGNDANGAGSAGTGVAYTFVPNSDLVEETRFMSDASTIAGRAKREFEAKRDLITSIENKWGSTVVSKYAYENDNLARRTSVVRTGSAFDADRVELWGYNNRNELASAHTHAGTNPASPGTEVADRARTYNYDPIGNRTAARDFTEAAGDTQYIANNLNQYTSVSRSGYLAAWVPQYDADGNMTDDGHAFTYGWDSENRLVTVTPKSPDTSSVQIKFDYDYMNRRVRKRTFAWTGLVWSGTAASDTRYVYDEWNLLLELNSGNAVTRKYTWGLDLSGQNGDPSASGLHGAGGIGGLLGCFDTNGTTVTTDDKALSYFYDANGNVGQLIESVSSSSPTPAAMYEYDAYGQTISSAGTFTASNPFRFSTKYLITEANQYDYGHRFYESVRGRWLSRDPIGEIDAPNLYEFSRNSPTMRIDPIGDQVIPIAEAKPVRCGPAQLDMCRRSCHAQGKSYDSAICYYVVTQIMGAQSHDIAIFCNCRDCKLKDPFDGDCTASQRAAFQTAVTLACKTAGSRRCTEGQKCATLLANLALNAACVTARQSINRICFKGGDLAHREELAKERLGVSKCVRLAIEECAASTDSPKTPTPGPQNK